MDMTHEKKARGGFRGHIPKWSSRSNFTVWHITIISISWPWITGSLTSLFSSDLGDDNGLSIDVH